MRAALDRCERVIERLVARQQRLLPRSEQDRQHDGQLRTVRAERLLRERQSVDRPSRRLQEMSKIARRGRDVRVIGSECTLAYRQGPAVKGLCLRMALLVLVEPG